MDRQDVADMDPDILMLDGFDGAIVGVVSRCGQPLIAVYSMSKMVDILREQDGAGVEEAVEYLESNVLGGWLGDRTPAVLMDFGQ